MTDVGPVGKERILKVDAEYTKRCKVREPRYEHSSPDDRSSVRETAASAIHENPRQRHTTLDQHFMAGNAGRNTRQ